jgi:Na+/proline symporter
MKAVMWTDAFQVVIMILGLALAIGIGIANIGSFRQIIEINWTNDRIEFFKLILFKMKILAIKEL